MSTGQLTNSILESFLADVPNANQDTITENGKSVAVKKERRDVFPPPSFSTLGPAASLALFGSSSSSSLLNSSTSTNSNPSNHNRSSASSSQIPSSSSSLFNNLSESRPQASSSQTSNVKSNQVDIKPVINNDLKKE